MKEQLTFGDIEYNGKKKKTRKELFLGQMEQIVPIKACVEVIRPFYPKSGMGRKVTDLEKLFRMYLVQSWYNTSDPATEDMVYDIQSVRAFVGIDLMTENVPDESVLCRFRHLLEKHGLTKKIFEIINESLAESGTICREGTIVDATLISAPSSTQNRDKKRDPEMSSTKKNNSYHFGLKLSIGADAKSGLVHSMSVDTAKTADIEVAAKVLHGEEERIYGDAGFVGLELREDIKEIYGEEEISRPTGKRGRKAKRKTKVAKVDFRINKRRMKIARMEDGEEKQRLKAEERAKSQVRAKVEYPFRIIKRNFGFQKTPYRGLKKAEAKLYMLVALANLYLAHYIKPRKPPKQGLSLPLSEKM